MNTCPQTPRQRRLRRFPKPTLLMVCALVLSACTDQQALKDTIKELKSAELELSTELATAESEVVTSNKKRADVEREARLSQRDVAAANLKTHRLTKRLSYLQTALKAANEQCDALNADVAKYKVKYLSKQ